MNESKRRPIETVFCAYDFSETAELARKQAVRLVRRNAARLVIAHVVEPIPLGPYPVLTGTRSELVIRDLATERLESLAAPLRADGLIVEVRVEVGRPGSQLISAAEDEAADLIVIGTRGLTGFKHLVIGSTADYVVRRSACPVLTLHPSDQLLKESPETVILPTDLSLDAACAADTFVTLFAESDRPRAILVYADEIPPHFEPFRHEMLQRWNQQDVIKEEIEAKLEPTAAILREAGFDVETAVLDGDPVTVMTDLARDRSADLIMLSTHGRSAVVNTLLGRTAQRIVQHAPCPVLTVRPQGRRAAE